MSYPENFPNNHLLSRPTEFEQVMGTLSVMQFLLVKLENQGIFQLYLALKKEGILDAANFPKIEQKMADIVRNFEAKMPEKMNS